MGLEDRAEELLKRKSINIVPISVTELEAAHIHPREILPNLLFADVRIRVAAGGTGKTTLQLHEAVYLALGWQLWGRKPAKPCRTVIVTREDSREILVARLREIMRVNKLTENDIRKVLSNIRIVDLTGNNFRLSMVAENIVIPDELAMSELIDEISSFGPDWIVFDPLVSFGVGESRVNDAEQGLIEAFRVIRNRLNCCVEGIHHTGKANAREKTTDQYSGRGGSALADGARMVVVLNTVTPAEWSQATGTSLGPDESGLAMSLPKLSYCTSQEPIYIRRRGYLFESVTASKRSQEQESEAIAAQVFQFICDQYLQGRQYSTADLDNMTSTLNLSRKQIRSACTNLKVAGRVLYHEKRGTSGSHYEPIITARVGETLPKDGIND